MKFCARSMEHKSYFKQGLANVYLVVGPCRNWDDNENGVVINCPLINNGSCIIKVSSDIIRNTKPTKIPWSPKNKTDCSE